MWGAELAASRIYMNLRPRAFICESSAGLRPESIIQACGLEALLGVGGCDSRVHWPGQVGGGVSSRSLHLRSWYQDYFGVDYESSIIFLRIALRLQSDYLFASV
jgi:hypothetical protein